MIKEYGKNTDQKMEDESLWRVVEVLIKPGLEVGPFTDRAQLLCHENLRSCEMQDSSMTKRNRKEVWWTHSNLYQSNLFLLFASFTMLSEGDLLTPPNNIIDFLDSACISFSISCMYFKTMIFGTYKFNTVIVLWWILFISNITGFST